MVVLRIPQAVSEDDARDRALTVLWISGPDTADGPCIRRAKKTHDVRSLTLAKALNGHRECQPDVVVLSIGLHDQPGDVVAALRRGMAGAAPVLVICESLHLDVKLDAFSAGADDYVASPYATAEVLARLSALARRGTRTGAPTLRAGPLQIDYDTRRLTVAGRVVDLQPKLMQLLYVLMREAPDSVSRAQLERELWPDMPGRSHQIRGMVWQLRRQFEPAVGAYLIESIHGVGYRICIQVASAVDPVGSRMAVRSR